MRRQLLSRTVLIWIFWIGLILCVAGVVLPLAGLRNTGNFVLGTGLAAIGLNLLLGGELIAAPLPRSFTVRGPVVRGHIEVRAGFSDLVISSGANDRIATVNLGPFGAPGFEVQEGIAQLKLLNPLLTPNISQWQAKLAGNVLWDLDHHSFVGDIDAALSDLRFEQVGIQTVFGGTHIVCPKRGFTRIEVRGFLGPISIHVPADTGARITVRGGLLSLININNPRLETIRRGRYETQGFDESAGQAEIHIEVFASEINLLD